MSADRETTRIVRSWLEDGVTQLPDNILDAVLDELPTTQQRRFTWWPARRPFEMNKAIALGGAAAVIAIVALVGIYTFRGPTVGHPPGVETTASPTPTATPEPEALVTGSEGPGTFITDFYSEAGGSSPITFTFEMPAGWEGVRPWVIGGQATVVFIQVSGLYADPCLANSGDPDVNIGSTAAELAAALVAHTAYEATETGTFRIDGHEGVRVQVVTPSDLDYATCEDESFWLWDGPLLAGAPSHFDIWIFDLDGTTTVALAEVTEVSAQSQAEIEQIVESIDIQP